jgi:predicted ATPase
MNRRPFLRRIRIRNFKSIAACDVALDRLTFLVGPNGAGKSNFLDAIRFVADALRSSIDHALRDRGTIKEVRRRSTGHPNHFAIRLDFTLPAGQAGHYAFRVGARPNGGFEIQDEQCWLEADAPLKAPHHFRVRSGKIEATSVSATPPAALPDRLFLVAASGMPEFRPVFDALTRMEVYNLNPDVVRAMQRPDPGEVLRRDGSNSASVFEQLPPAAKREIKRDLGRIVPGITDLEVKTLGAQETIEFRQAIQEGPSWRFPAIAMSDGTLRAFGVLLAISQAMRDDAANRAPLFVGIEEPEVALHPAAASVLLSALRRGANHTQIAITSHSPELLDNQDIGPEQILSVVAEHGATVIGALDPAAREILRKRLFTPGEMLRQNQLGVDPNVLASVQDERQMRLFET